MHKDAVEVFEQTMAERSELGYARRAAGRLAAAQSPLLARRALFAGCWCPPARGGRGGVSTVFGDNHAGRDQNENARMSVLERVGPSTVPRRKIGQGEPRQTQHERYCRGAGRQTKAESSVDQPIRGPCSGPSVDHLRTSFGRARSAPARPRRRTSSAALKI